MDKITKDANIVYLRGILEEDFTFSHRTRDSEFYTSAIRVNRLSGTSDLIPILVCKQKMEKFWQLDLLEFKRGDSVYLSGNFKSLNRVEKGKSRLKLFVQVNYLTRYVDLSDGKEFYSSYIKLEGYVCKQPVYRVTPLNREIADILLANNYGFGKTNYLPLILWGKNAEFANNSLKQGDKISVIGRIQSREYHKVLPDGKQETRVAYEVSCNSIEVIQ